MTASPCRTWLRPWAKTLFGKLFGDKGYISQPLFEQLLTQGLELITPRRKI